MKKKTSNRRNNALNSIANFIYTENQYYHIVPTKITYRNKEQELRDDVSKEINKKAEQAKRDAINGITGGDNIKITKTPSTETGVTINVRLSENYSEKSRHVDKEYTPVKDENLDEVTKKLFKAISENGDTIDGERIDISSSNGSKNDDSFIF